MFHPDGPTFFELARQALSSTERGYDLLAPKFDVTPFRTPTPIVDVAARFIREHLRCERLLDLCCGTGAVLERSRGSRTFGLDLSTGMLRVAQSRVPTAHFVRADALVPPFRRAFDVVTCFGAVGHILPADQPRFVRAAASCLVPGGHFVFVTASAPPLRSLSYWLARGFNAAMHVRNALWSPRFDMYYLTFLLPEARSTLEEAGFQVDVHPGLFAAPFEKLVLVDARSG